MHRMEKFIPLHEIACTRKIYYQSIPISFIWLGKKEQQCGKSIGSATRLDKMEIKCFKIT